MSDARSASEEQLQQLLTAAREASTRAYAPYSRFSVGAAVLTSEGTVFTGCNVENASYGLTICAERVAIFKAASAGAREIFALAVFTPTATATAPCGACRQVAHEFGPQMTVVWAGNDARLSAALSSLLPSAFGPADLME